jgi:hypothetical protein
MKKALFILITVIILGFLFFGFFQYFLSSRTQKGALQITSTPESQVYLNDKLIGQTPLCKCEAGDTLDVGEYKIRLVPSGMDGQEYQEKIKISEGVLTVVDRKFGTDSNSSGSVISLTPLSGNSATELLVVSIPSKAIIYLDNNRIGETPYLLKNPTVSDHSLRVVKEGYEEKAVRIRTPEGYKLTVAMYLSTNGSGEEGSASTAAFDSSRTPSPTPAVTVTILQTPTGFLRVRSSASIASSEIAQVTPGESFELLSEQSGWYQIKLKDGNPGWISAQYAGRD